MAKKQVKVFVFSRQPLFRNGIVHTISDEEDIQILGQAGVTENVMLTIEVMPPGNGINLAQRLKRVTPSVAILVMTSRPGEDQLLQLLSIPVAAYFSKEVNGQALLSTIRRIPRGDLAINESLANHPELVSKILAQFQQFGGEDDEFLSPLTGHEVEILNYLAKGESNKKIATALNISEQTIKNHITSIMAKLNANARTQAVVIAVRKGLISIDQKSLKANNYDGRPHSGYRHYDCSRFFIGEIAHRLRLPRIFGYIVAGVLMSPSLLNVFGKNTVSDLEISTPIALSIIAYSIGGSLHLPELKHLKNRSPGFCRCKPMVLGC